MAETTPGLGRARPSAQLVALLLMFALFASACGGTDTGLDVAGGDGIEEDAAAGSDSTANEPDSDASEAPDPDPTEPPKPTPPEPTVVPAPTPEPEPVGIVLPDIERHDFAWGEGDTDWDVSVFGWYETDRDDGDDPGSCVVLVGVMIPTLIDEGIAADSSDAPQFGVAVGDEYIEEDAWECAVGDLEDAGFARAYDTDVITGAPYNFFAEVTLEDAAPSAVTDIVIGDPEEQANKTLYLDPLTLASLPSIVAAPLDLVAPGGDSVVGATVAVATDDVEWQFDFHGLTTVETADGDDDAQCTVITGTATPVSTNEGISVDWAPPLAIVVDGIVLELESGGSCATDNIWNQGYQSLTYANVTIDTPFAFQRSVRIPPALSGQPTSVLVGNPHSTNDWAWSLTALDAEYIDTVPDPAPPVNAPNHPGTQGSMANTTVTWTHPFSGVEWSITMQGVVEGEALFGDEGTCYTVVGTMIPTALDDEEPADGFFDGPDFGILANGHYLEDFASSCDTDAVEAAGYLHVGDAELDLLESFYFFADIEVPTDRGLEPSVFVLGDPTEDGAQFFDLARINGTPTPGETTETTVLVANSTGSASAPAAPAPDDTDETSTDETDETDETAADAVSEPASAGAPIKSSTDEYIDPSGWNNLETSGTLSTGDAVRRIPLSMKAGEAVRWRLDAPDGADLIAILAADPITTQGLADWAGEPNDFDDLYTELAERHPEMVIDDQVMFIGEGDLLTWLAFDDAIGGEPEAGRWLSPVDADYTLILTYFSDYSGAYDLTVQQFNSTIEFGDFEEWVELFNTDLLDEPFFSDEGFFGSTQE